MAELAAAGAFDGLGLPFETAACRLAALPEVRRLGVAPFAGQHSAVAQALGIGLPAFGQIAETAAGRIIPFAIGQWLVEGVAMAGLDGHAALTDQSDGWAGLALSGPEVRAVLARLVPLDLDMTAFPPGAMARTQLRHVPALVVAAVGSIEILVPRSYARTAVSEIEESMRGLLRGRDRPNPTAPARPHGS